MSTHPPSTTPKPPRSTPASTVSPFPGTGPQTSIPLVSAKHFESSLTSNAPASPLRTQANPISDSTLLLVILGHISPPACVYIFRGAGYSFWVNLALTEMRSELGPLHAWYLLYRSPGDPGTLSPSHPTIGSSTSDMQPCAGISQGSKVGEWWKRLLHEFQEGFDRGFWAGLQRHGIKTEVLNDETKEDERIDKDENEIAKSLRELWKVVAEAARNTEDLEKVVDALKEHTERRRE